MHETLLCFIAQIEQMVKVAQIPQRPRYRCEKCDKDFPSVLDLEEHFKIDHATVTPVA